MTQGGETPDERLNFGFRLVLGPPPRARRGSLAAGPVETSITPASPVTAPVRTRWSVSASQGPKARALQRGSCGLHARGEHIAQP